MQAIVFANRTGNELAPLNQQYCPALLPVANKALVEYTLEDLASAGVTDVKLVICSDAKKSKVNSEMVSNGD
ncbi:sugar phosphate nucleotidyltransferase [Shewanella sp. ENK2]|uniref:sugar phosphate nucleotidyltransferase n=1 Tax=Shewanella sp. ENK2 TaxID=2775245 RepID=UPI0037478AB7